MSGHLHSALFANRPVIVERCTPTRPLYLPGQACALRYRLEARDGQTGAELGTLVTGRVFPTEAECEAYLREKVSPLALRMRGRPEVAGFSAVAAVIEPLNMVVHVWPVDGELPTLVDATDRELMRRVLDDDVCAVERVSYRRRQRCVLRYTIPGRDPVYGKVTGAGTETLAHPQLDVLRERLEESGAPYRLTTPRLLAWRPELRLALLEAVPGEARIRTALRARLRGGEATELEAMIDTCAQAATAVHASGIALGRARDFDAELASVTSEVAVAREFAPKLADWAQSILERVATLAARSNPLELHLAHGDYNHGQLLFEDARAALLDLDGVCLAEPPLDLGSFVAHLRADAENLRRRLSGSSTLGDELAERFLGAYAEDVHERAQVYEALALVRLAVRSAHGFEATRLEIATDLLYRMPALE